MGFAIPDAFTIIGSDMDVTGSTQISAGKGIGGGADDDGHDEATTFVQNARYCWASGNLACLFNLFSRGDHSPSASIAEVAHAEHALGRVVLEIPADGAESRPDFILDYDMEKCFLEIEFYNSSDVSLGSAFTSTVTTRHADSKTITGITTPESIDYITIKIRPLVDGPGKLYGVRLQELEGDL